MNPLLIESTRTTLTIVVLLILPGYTLMFALFPLSRGDSLSRFFFSILTSICLTVCTAYTLMRLRNGLQPLELFVTLEVLTFFLAVAGWLHYLWAKKQTDLVGSYALVSKNTAPNIGGVLRVIFATILISFSGTAFVSLTAASRHEQPMTEFYISPQYIQEEGFVLRKETNRLIVPVSINNLEGEAQTYTILGVIDGNQIYESESLYIDNHMSWSGEISLNIEESQQKGSLDLLLFAKNKEGSIAHLDFWLSDAGSALAQDGFRLRTN